MPRRIHRRAFLQASAGAALAGAALGAGLRVPGVGSSRKPTARRVLTREFHLGPSELAEGSRNGLTASSGGLKVAGGRESGQFLSPVIKSDLAFDYVGLFWSGVFPPGDSAVFWVRTSPDGREWSPWETVLVEMPPGPHAQYDTYGSLISADRASYVQFLGALEGFGQKPELSRVGLILLNPYDGPEIDSVSEPAEAVSADIAHAAEADPYADVDVAPEAATGKPVDFKREDWGADESLRYSGSAEIWPRSYVPTKKLVVHHTVTGNGYYSVAEAKALVRAIYTYHASTLGWGDIGYNCLIDRFGNSYEGRRGRNGPGYDGPGGREILSHDVVAGHALAYNYGSSGIALLGTFCTPSECAGGSPTSAMISRLKDVLEWECRKHGVNPRADSDFLFPSGTWHRNLRNLVGHRDVGNTSCPGGYVYALLPQIRSAVADRLASPAKPTVSITSAPAEGTVKKGEVTYAWKGSGGSGGLKYSYCLEGWSKVSSTGKVKYVRGFNSKKSPIWSRWTKDTTARLCYVAKGVYTFHVRVKDSNGRVSVYHKTRSFWGTAQSNVCNGALLQGSGSKVYVMQGGLKRHIPNPVTFEGQGFFWGNINHVSSSFVGSISSGEPVLNALDDGNLLKGSGSAVYVMEGGRKRHITSLSAFVACGYGWDAVRTITDGQLSGIGEGANVSGPPCPHLSPPGGTLIKGDGGKVYVMRKGLKRHIPNPVTLGAEGFQWGNVNRIAESDLAAISTGDAVLDALDDGNLLKGSGSAVYVMDGGQRRHVTSVAAMSACGYDFGAVRTISDVRLNSIPIGPSLSGPPCPQLSPPSGSLVQGGSSPVYVMRQGLKRHVPNLVTFGAEGYRWGNVNRIADSHLSAIPTGDPLLDTLADGNLLRGSGPDVYVMEGGARRLVAGPTAMDACGYGSDAVREISDSSLGAIPLGSDLSEPPCPRLIPPDGALIRGSGTAVYVMDAGLRRHIVDLSAFSGCGYLWGNVNLMADSTLDGIPVGDDLIGEPCP